MRNPKSQQPIFWGKNCPMIKPSLSWFLDEVNNGRPNTTTQAGTFLVPSVGARKGGTLAVTTAIPQGNFRWGQMGCFGVGNLPPFLQSCVLVVVM